MGQEKNTKQCEEKIDLHANVRAVPDGGWGWIISFAAFTVQFIILGLQNHLGLIHREHLAHFGESSLKTGWVSSLALGNMFLFAPLTSALCEKFGCRRVGFIGGLITVVGMLASSFAPNLYTLYFTFGMVYGIGTSMCYFPTLRTLPYWFSRNLALANGIAASGSGVGTVAVGPLLQVLLSTVGWRNTLRIFAAFLLIPTLAALAYCVPESRNKKEKEANLPKPKTKIVDFTVLKNPAFLVLCVAMSTFMLGYFVPFIHVVIVWIRVQFGKQHARVSFSKTIKIARPKEVFEKLTNPRYAQDLKIEDDKASNLIGIMSVGSTFGRLFFGKLSDHPRVNRLYLYQMSFLCIGAIQTLVPQITNFAGFAMYMVSFGVFDGCFIVLLAIVVSDVVGIDRVSTGMGVKFFFMAITTFVGPPFAGWLVDISGSYDLAFYTAGGSAFLAFLLLFFVPCLMPRDMRIRNRMAYDVAVEERAEDEECIYEKEYPFGGCPEIKTEDISDPTSTDSSLLSPPTFSKPRSLLSVHSTLNPKKSTLSIHSREPSLRASWLEVSCAVAGGDPSLLPPDVVHRGKSTPNLQVLERMTTVNPKKSTLSIHFREPPLRASWLEVSCAVAGGDPSLLPPDVVRRGKSTPNLQVLEHMTTV